MLPCLPTNTPIILPSSISISCIVSCTLHAEGLSFQLPNSPFKKSRLGPPSEKLVLYRGRGMLPFRFLVRAKVSPVCVIYCHIMSYLVIYLMSHLCPVSALCACAKIIRSGRGAFGEALYFHKVIISCFRANMPAGLY